MTEPVKPPVNSMFPFIYIANDYHDFDDKSQFLSEVLQSKVKFKELAEGQIKFLGIHAIYAAVIYVGKLPQMSAMKELLKTRGAIEI